MVKLPQRQNLQYNMRVCVAHRFHHTLGSRCMRPMKIITLWWFVKQISNHSSCRTCAGLVRSIYFHVVLHANTYREVLLNYIQQPLFHVVRQEKQKMVLYFSLRISCPCCSVFKNELKVETSSWQSKTTLAQSHVHSCFSRELFFACWWHWTLLTYLVWFI